MLDEIQSQIKEASDRQAVMILLHGIEAPLVVLKIKSEALSGDLWIADGKYLCYGKVEPNGEGGLLDILRLLAVKEGQFELSVSHEKRPECPLSITVAELMADEHAVATKIKNKLWPVVEVAAAEDEPPVVRAGQVVDAETHRGHSLEIGPADLRPAGIGERLGERDLGVDGDQLAAQSGKLGEVGLAGQDEH